MCGDGANDCGALKAAHVGISLSEAESSVASAFTAKEQNISCVPKVIKEGRAALVTSFGVFKIMVCYSLTELASVIILYNIDANLSSPEFLFIDVFLVLNFASVFGMTKAFSILSTMPPTSSLMTVVPIMSIVCFLTISTGFQVLANLWIQTYEWFTPFVYKEGDQSFVCYENFAIFSVSMFQYIGMAIVFSKGKPYRQPLCTNLYFSLSLTVATVTCLYLTLCPHPWIANVIELKIPPMEGRLAMVIIGLGCFLSCFIAEEVFVEFFLHRMILKELKALRKSKVNFLLSELEEGIDFNKDISSLSLVHERKQSGIVNKGFVGSKEMQATSS